jgi:hypothetical protein
MNTRLFSKLGCFGELIGSISFDVLSFGSPDGATCETRLICQIKGFTDQYETR